MVNKTSYNFIKVKCNEDSYVECWIAYYIWRTVPFALIGLGTCGNLLNFVVLFRKRIRKYSTSVYFLFLSGSDLVVLWSGTALDTRESITGTLITDTTTFMCRFVRFISISSAGYSAWLLVLLTFERILLSKKHTFDTPKMTRKFAIVASTVTLFAIMMFTGHLIFGFHLEEIDFHVVTNASRYDKRYKCTFTSVKYKMFYYDIWRPLILLFLNVIPVIVIVCGNIAIGVPILQQRKRLRRVFPEATAVARNQQRKSPAKMLILISATFLVTTLPYTIYLVVKRDIKYLDEHTFALHQLITVIISMLLYSNFTFNFLLYFVSGTLFKQEWQNLTTEIYDKVRKLQCRTGHQSEIINIQNIA